MLRITIIIGSALSIVLWIIGLSLETIQTSRCVPCDSVLSSETAPTCSLTPSVPCQNLMNALSAALGMGFLLFLFFWLINICLAAAAVKVLWFWALVLSPICILTLTALAFEARATTLLIELVLTCGLVPNLLFGLSGLKRTDVDFIKSYPA
jgi:hypothetical protein